MGLFYIRFSVSTAKWSGRIPGGGVATKTPLERACSAIYLHSASSFVIIIPIYGDQRYFNGATSLGKPRVNYLAVSFLGLVSIFAVCEHTGML
jgi:hypothetical protein